MTKVNLFNVIENNSIKYTQCLEYLKGCNQEEIIEAVGHVYKKKSRPKEVERGTNGDLLGDFENLMVNIKTNIMTELIKNNRT